MQLHLLASAIIFIAISGYLISFRNGRKLVPFLQRGHFFQSSKTALLILLFSGAAKISLAKNYYFSEKGSDSYTSTQAQNPTTPWKSLAKLSSFFSNFRAGDSVLLKRGDTFRGSIVANASGTASSPITISSYGSGNAPVITLPAITGWQKGSNGVYSIKKQMWPDLSIFFEDGKPLLQMASSSDCKDGKWWCDYRNLYYKPTSGKIDDQIITVANIIPVSPGDYEPAINVSNSSYITIDKLQIDAYGIGVRTYDDKASTAGLTVQNCVFNYCQRGTLLMPNAGTNKKTTIKNCLFYRNQCAVNVYSALFNGRLTETQGTNIDCKIIDNEMSENGTIDGVTIWPSRYGTDYEAIGVQNFMDGTISNNYIHDGYQIGIIFYNIEGKSSDNNTVSNNRVIENKKGGFIFQGDNCSEGLAANYAFNNNVISNNLFVNSVSDFDGTVVIYPGKNTNRMNYFVNNTLSGDANIIYFPTSKTPFFTIENNIIYNSGTYRFVAWRWAGRPANLVMDYNLYFEDNGKKNWGFATTKGLSLKAMQELGLETHSISVNPSFVNVNASNYNLQGLSPAVNAGTDVGLPFTGSAPDLGAFEFGKVEAPVTPDAPELTANDTANTLSASHPLGDSVILVCENGGPYVPYTGTIMVGNTAKEPGYWRFKVKAALQRNESAVVLSPAFTLISTPAAPTLMADDSANTLSASHPLGDSVILICENGGPYLAYAGVVKVDNVARPAGYWKFKIKAAPQRNESPVVSSPAFTVTVAPVTPVKVFRSKSDGNWSDINVWEFSSDSIHWVHAPKVPDYTDDAITIRGGHSILIDSTVTVDQLKIESQGALQVAPNASIIVNDGLAEDINIDPTASMIIKSDSTGTGSLGKSLGTINGVVTVERYIPARRSWWLLTAPVQANTAQTLQEAWQEGATSTTNDPNPGYGTHLTGGTAEKGFDQSPSNSSNIKYYSNAWLNISNTKLTRVTDRDGYFLFVRGNRSYDISNSSAASSPSATTLRVKGALNEGAKKLSFTAANANQFVLAGNPYAAAVDFSTVTKNNIKNTFWAWDAQRSGTSSGGYVTVSWDEVAGEYDIDYSARQTKQTQIIQSGQAVLVQVQKGNTPSSLTFNQTDKVASANGANVFRQARNAGISNQFRIALSRKTGSASTMVDGVLAKFAEGYSRETSDDALKLSNYDENMSFKREGLKFSIERRPLIDENDTLFLNLEALKANADYNFNFEATSFEGQAITAILVDKYSGVNTPISLTKTNSVAFKTDGNPAGIDTSRFMIVFKTASILPITLTGIKAQEWKGSVQVKWDVQDETGVQQYVVEKSGDMRRFSEIAVVSAKNKNTSESYRHDDLTPFDGDNYYRIKIVSNTGAVSYSGVARVTLKIGHPSFQVYPNPVKDKRTTVQLNSVPKGDYSLTIYDQSGRQLLRNTVKHDGESLSRELVLPASTASGTYHIVLSSLSGDSLTLQQTILVL